MRWNQASPMEIAAHAAVVNGWTVFPLKPRDKVPLTPHGCLDASQSHEQVTTWWTRWPDANLGLATGTVSGVLVVDVDGADGEIALEQYGPLLATVEARTGKGRHLYFTLPNGVRLGNSARRLGPQLDTRGDGGYVVAPPSIHPNGHAYQWAPGRSPDDTDLTPLPDAILRKLQTSAVAKAPARLPASLMIVAEADRRSASRFLSWLRTVDCALAEGEGRNSTAFRIASRAREAGFSFMDVNEYVRAWNAANLPPLDEYELDRCVDSAFGIRRQGAA